MEEKPGYGAQLFILIAAIVLFAGLSRALSDPGERTVVSHQLEELELRPISSP